MEDKKNIIKIQNNSKFNLSLAKNFLKKSKWREAIGNLNVAFNLSEDINEQIEIRKLLIEAYMNDKDFDLALIHSFLLMTNRECYNIALVRLYMTYYNLNDYQSAIYFMEKYMSGNIPEEEKNILNDNIQQFKKMQKEENNLKLIEENLLQARKSMLKEKYADATLHYESTGLKKDENVRSEMVFSLFLQDKFDEAIELLEKFGTETSSKDMSNLLFAYFFTGNNEKFEKTKEKLKNLPITSSRETFKAGLVLAQTGDSKLGAEFMERSFREFGSSEIDVRIEFAYALTLLNNKEFEKARFKFIDLKKIDPIRSFVYDFYIKASSNKKDVKYDYVDDLPFVMIKKIEKTCLKFAEVSDEDLRNKFDSDKSFFYYLLVMMENDARNALLLRLATFDGEEFDKFFNYVFVMPNIKYEIKSAICYLRLPVIRNIDSFIVRMGNHITRVIFPKSFIKIRENDLPLFHAICSSVRYFLINTPAFELNFENILAKLEFFIKNKNLDDKFLSCLLTVLSAKSLKLDKNKYLLEICKYYGFSRDEFLDEAKKISIII